MLSHLIAMIAAQAAPAALQPEGAWQLDMLEIGCRVSRAYTGEAHAEFGFETGVTTSGPVMLLSAPKAMLPEGIGSIRVAASGQTAEVHYGAFATSDPEMRLLKLFPDKDEVAALASADTIEIGAHPVRIAGKGIEPALKALDDCTAKLIAGWGADPGLYRDGKLARPAGSPGSWFTADDYRHVVKSGGAHPQLVLLVTTGADGKPTACRAVSSSDHSVDDATCAIALRRSRFAAPLGADGKPMASYAVLPVHWDTH
jgi:hypothetical protein